ncbi:hypothetical protein EDD86DRAFT_184112, partial [Gorgonomyces haynaldii]
MKFVALISGGKDSIFSIMHSVALGHELVGLVNLRPKVDEDDSYMFQSVGHNVIDLYQQMLGVPVYRRTLTGTSKNIQNLYQRTEGDEIEDLFLILQELQQQIGFQAISTGAILSSYQRLRVEHVSMRLGLVSLGYLWQMDQEQLLQSMIDAGLEAILIKVACAGLDQRHLGKTLSEMQPHLLRMQSKYGIHVCGEGGEFESLVLDAPIFKQRMVIDETQTVVHSDDMFAPVVYLKILQVHLEPKEPTKLVLPPPLLFEPLEIPDFDYQRPEIAFDLDASESQPSVFVSGSYLTINCLESQHDNLEQSITDMMQQMQSILSENQFEWQHLVQVAIFCRELSDFANLNKIYGSFFTTEPPTRVTVGASIKSRVRMDVVAYRDPKKENLHVQSISYWAPANIGPYSQAFKTDGLLWMAGQIGLVPETMTVDTSNQAARAWHHIKIVARNMSFGLECLYCICYIDDLKKRDQALAVWKKDMGLTPLLIVSVPELPRG